MRRWGVAAGLALLLGGLSWLFGGTAPVLEVPVAVEVLDRDERLLRAFPVEDGRWRLATSAAALDPDYLALLLTIEDRRFERHPGVDPRALARAAWQWATRGRIVSGGSTLTMQLARLRAGHPTRTPAAKLAQIRTALALERAYPKSRILDAYLTLAPFGGNLEGVRAGALAWFGKEPRRLDLAEAALLVALPQAPEARRPDRHPEAARRARDRVLALAEAAGLIDARARARAAATPVPRARRALPARAAHLAARLHRAEPARVHHQLTLDGALQARLEPLALARARGLGPRVSVALLVADHRAGTLLAHVGAAAPFDQGRRGWVDMTRAVRSPGSTLKPLIYALAFEAGVADPAGWIEDRARDFHGYAPRNLDRDYQGRVAVAQALQRSLNVPAVTLLEALGPQRLLGRLRRVGVAPRLPPRAQPGLALALGGVGLSLEELFALYGALANDGRPLALHHRRGAAPATSPGTPLVAAGAARRVGAILAAAPPVGTAPGRGIAHKTGTSYGHRDAWALGYDGRHLVGVWVGRADGAPVPGLTGAGAAAPLLRDVFARLGPGSPLPEPPPARAPAPALTLAGVPRAGPRIAYPPAGSRVALGLDGDGAAALLRLRVHEGRAPFQWFADGVPIGRAPVARTLDWWPREPGYVDLAVVDARGESDRVRVWLE
ncbi:penicillin-binding protein 1C [Marichromatium sp. PS1]|uniref:penicillin-binding protein 1C n=1 Tax=Marichromatium sp. PS1 TaxID=3138932 RepID=UPI0032E561DB